MKVNNLRLLKEAMGLAPLPVRIQQTKLALKGDVDIPRSQFGLSSLQQLHPKIGPTLWRGKPYLEKTVFISNLFNHVQTPISEGWSVKRTQVKDFRGKQLSYNSHNGTDFAIPVGTAVHTAAAGKVVAVMSEFNRGGLKIFIDHGQGLMTTYAHLAKATVEVGEVLSRGQQIAWSGYSGLDGVVSYPWGIPHVHFNVWFNGQPTDPFPWDNNASLWIGGDLPMPAKDNSSDFQPSVYDPSKVAKAIAACKSLEVRDRLESIEDISYRAANVLIEMNYYPTRFAKSLSIYTEQFERKPMLDLPFYSNDFNQVLFIDDFYEKNYPRVYKRKYTKRMESSY